MQINKTSVLDSTGHTARETSRNTQSSKAVSAKVEPSAFTEKSSKITSRSVLSMINASNLPVDKLSASIITFARFFSLPLKPEIMAEIRRQVLTVPSGEAHQDEALKQTAAESKTQLTAKYRDALSMTAAAGESKGVELQPKALEFFAEAVDPELRGRQKENQNRGKKKNQNEQKEENASLKQVSVSASGLEKMAMEYLEKNTLLDLLNKLPGKNGQRWIVIPLDFSQNGKEYCVSLKILLGTEKTSNHFGLMALDIAEAGNSKNRKSFVAEAVNNHITKLSIYSRSDLPAKDQKSLKRELSGILNIHQNSIYVQTRDDILYAGYNEHLLTSVDEAV